ncbi:MAG TPA: cytochrome c oxidase subunit I, partial [Candidatus Methylomirabilis sp.]
LITFNTTFFPMHFLGLAGMVRRIANPLQYPSLEPLQPLNVFITVSAIGLILAQVPFAFNILRSLRAGEPAPANPWEATTLEWSTASPPPHDNWGETAPAVYRWAYEYSSPEVGEDWLPQDRLLALKS